MNTVFEVLSSESNAKLSALSRNQNICAFVQGVVQHMTILCAARGLGAKNVRITAPAIQDGDLLTATIQFDGLAHRGGRKPEPMRARGAFLDFVSAENSEYALFFKQNHSLQVFVERLLESLTSYANHYSAPLTNVILETPYVVHDQYIRARIGIFLAAPGAPIQGFELTDR